MKLHPIPKYILLGTLALLLLNWGGVFENKIFLVPLIIILYLLLMLALFLQNRLLQVGLIIIFLAALSLQIATTRFWNEYELSPFEKDRQLQRANYYPPRQGKLGNTLEINGQMQSLYKLQSNFFSVLDFNLYFPNYFSFFAAPFFLHGLYIFATIRNKLLVTLFLTSLTVLAFLGTRGLWGPFLIFPFILLFINISLNKLADLLIKK